MPNLSALAPLTTAATALSNLILVSPESVDGIQPQNPFGDEKKPRPKAFLFNQEGEQTLNAESDITDHYVEKNYAVQDQIALKPVVYTVRGFIGELNDVPPDFLKPIRNIANKLTAIAGYEPQLTTTGLIAYSQAFFLYQVAQNTRNAAVSAWSSVSNLLTGGGSPPQNEQQKAFNELYGYWGEKRLFSVRTPWNVFVNMAIQKLTVIQGEDTRTISDFEITFKQIRFAATELGSSSLSNVDPVRFQGHSASQMASAVNLGTFAPGPTSVPLSTGIASIG